MKKGGWGGSKVWAEKTACERPDGWSVFVVSD